MSSAETQPDFNPNDTKQDELRKLLIAMMIVPTVVVLVRAWSRALMTPSAMSKTPNKFWWDDWTAFAGAVLNIAVCIIGLKLLDLGLGLHVQVIPPENVKPFLKLLWVVYYIFDTGTAVSKSSALFFYARVFGSTNSRFKYALWLVHAMNVIWLVTILLDVTFMCTPIAKAWDTTLDGHCLNTGRFWMGSGITSLIIDIIILVMPMPMLWKLHMKTIRKIQILGVFICGYLVVVVSIGRLVTIIQAGDEVEKDPTYKISTPILWLGSEIAISIISVSLPSIFFLGQRVYRHGASSLLSTNSPHSKTGLSSNHRPFHDEDGDELVRRSTDSLHKHPESLSDANPYLTQTKATAQFTGTEESIEHTQHAGIHVRHDVMVA
ncbi:hypothetical protein GL218_03013 [Daldinia childiae]|uniref:uncharacterized protein n=1 Tax=Daldinia childiae TaxID=326645 RepID=UPI001447DCEC|nr:uncharacterized protein GL218_03013 [Daldinia childiae]KAF3061499.1 hypothetical protein GL218_03013 [Daldinia childiae]